MSRLKMVRGDRVTICGESLGELFGALEKGGYKIIGPTVRDGAVVYDRLSSAAELPRGWRDQTDSARYRLIQKDDAAWFGFNLGPTSWKKFLLPPRRLLWSAEKEKAGFAVAEEKREFENLALLGVRPCELAAIRILDRVLGEGDFRDPGYIAAREKTLIVAVNCGQAGGTCYCASMGTGPKAESGFDLALTELSDNERHFIVVEVGSEKGATVTAGLAATKSTPAELAAAAAQAERVAKEMGRTLDTDNLKAILERNFEHPRWEAAGKRCLTCGNCTMVCPTCFCTTVEDVTDLTGRRAERHQRWDSCHTMDFSYIHGGSIRPSAKARYRQMVTHKLAAWHDQFGSAGCVGCGRCIAWCPAGIDITEEVRAICDGDRARVATASI